MNNEHATNILKAIPELLSTSSDVETCIDEIIKKAKDILLLKNVALYYISEENAYLKQATNNKYFENFYLSKDLLAQIENNNLIEIKTKELALKFSIIESTIY